MSVSPSEILMILYTKHPMIICPFFLLPSSCLSCIHVGTHVCIHMYAHVCGDPKLISPVFLGGSLSIKAGSLS